jgi:hypothetical protein
MAGQRLPTPAELILDRDDASLLDLLDNALNKGVVLNGELTLGLAKVELIYARLSLLLCAADRVLPPDPSRPTRRRRHRGTRTP